MATHLLESMIENPIPTRAEVTDVANAIYEGVDAVMLSGETSIGKYPVRCVEQLSEISNRTERFPGLGYEKDLVVDNDKQHVAVHAVALAEALDADGIVVINAVVVSPRDYVDQCSSHACTHLCIHQSLADPTADGAQSCGFMLIERRFSSDPEKTLQRAFTVSA